MNIDINKNRNFILSVICVVFIVFTIVFVSVISLSKNGLINNKGNFNEVKDNRELYGNNLHGYIELSPLWVQVESEDPDDLSLYFKSKDGYLLTMSAFNSNETKAVDLSSTLYKSINNKDYAGVESTNEMINGYVAYKVYGYNLKVNKWLYTWTFEDYNGITHFISIEGSEKSSTHFLIPSTYLNRR